MKKALWGSKSKKNDYPAFTNFTIKVEIKNAWQDTVKMVIGSVEGVKSFKMDKDGKVHISGYVDPNKFLNCLKKAGRKAEMVQWRYGECSNNLHEVTEKPSYPDVSNEYRYGYNNGYNYGYEYSYPRYERNYAYGRLECSGNAEDCDGHHNESSSSIPKRITTYGEASNYANGSQSCNIM